jgi:hypothetical protein
MLRKDTNLFEALRTWLRDGRTLDGESFYRLRSAGILKGELASAARPRCQLYGEYLKSHLT